MAGLCMWSQTMPKFFFDKECLRGNYIDLTGEAAHHIINVLRHNLGDDILLCDGNLIDYATKLLYYETDKKYVRARFEVIESKVCHTEPPIFIRLFQAAIKWENFDFAIQKSVEVGVSEIVPVVTERSIYKIEDVKKKQSGLTELQNLPLSKACAVSCLE